MNKAVMFSSKSDNWRTPESLFLDLHREFRFQIDLAASATNALLARYFTKRDDALSRQWHLMIGARVSTSRGFCNPPYSRGLQKRFIEKAAQERRRGFTTVMLLPARTDTKAFHDHIWDAARTRPRRGVEVRFLRGRLRFRGAKQPAPFPSMVVVFRGARS